MFSKKPESIDRPPSNAAIGGSTFSVLGPDIAITGDLSAKVDVHLDGKIDGNIRCAGLVQGEASEVTGAVAAESARVAGRIKGSISAEALVILRTARIEGDVTYGTLTVEEGAQVDGKFMRRNAEPKLVLAGGMQAN